MSYYKGYKTNRSFERTELRTLLNTYDNDVETFINIVADMIGKRDEKIELLNVEVNNLRMLLDEQDNES